jgi:sulfopyruvate decarboxylase TPP-binding subunit
MTHTTDQEFDEVEWRRLVEEGGGIFVGVQRYGREPIVLFQSSVGESTLALYASALNSKLDVELAIKAYREACDLVRVEGL